MIAAVDDGLFNGNLNVADVAFLVATIVFAVLAVLAWARAKTIEAGLSSFGLALVAFGLLVL